ncbi:MAG: PLP-dependent aspartate aminotransferase family protein [Candidatus Margulisiibacteriota bacterium]
MKFETKAIHEGQRPDPLTGSVIVPVYQTSTFKQETIGKHKGFEYSRTGNPTRQALETALASLEGGKHGLAFASGVAATTAVFNLLKSGDHVIAGNDIYGGTYRLLEKVFKRWGLKVSYADVTRPQSFRKAINSKTKLIWIESPTNPLLWTLDIKELAAISHKNNLLLAVDNTFATPYYQRPLELGADIVVHSTTKYLAGHSDIIGGAAITSNEKVFRALKFYQNSAGAVPGPWDTWLVLRGLKTLAVRMREHTANATFLAEYIKVHPKVAKIHYPGFGGMLSFELKGDLIAVNTFFSNLKLFMLAESLGGVESLVCYPPKMTHASLSKSERLKRGIKDNLIRLSVGIENKYDLKNDLAQALEHVKI